MKEEKNHSHCLNICARQDQPSAQLEEAHSLAATISHEWCPQLCHLAALQRDLSSSESESRVQLFEPHGLYSPWNSPGQNTGVGSLSLPQGIFPTQGLNPGLPHGVWILCQLSHKRSPRPPEWEAYLFSSGSSQPRNRRLLHCRWILYQLRY